MQWGVRVEPQEERLRFGQGCLIGAVNKKVHPLRGVPFFIVAPVDR